MEDIFEEKEHALLYAKYRPSYPEYIYQSIIDYCRAGDRTFTFDLAVDVACGSGQSTLPLCKYFNSVVGIDSSEPQIAAVAMLPDAGSYNNVNFRVESAEDMRFLSSNSVDLITIATALNWVPMDPFYAEVKRILKPNGVFAAYGYTVLVLSLPEAEKLNLAFNSDLLADFWDSRTFDRLKHRASPFPEFERREGDDVPIHRTMTVDEYIGYLSTYSSYRTYLAKNPNSDALQILRSRILDVYRRETKQDNPVISGTVPAFMMLARKPS